MMHKLTENTIEQSFIDQLISQGYTYYNGTDISPISDNPQRESFASVLLEQHFKDSLKKLNPTLPESARVEAYQKVLNLGTEDIMENNERFHTLLTNGVTVEYTKDDFMETEFDEYDEEIAGDATRISYHDGNITIYFGGFGTDCEVFKYDQNVTIDCPEAELVQVFWFTVDDAKEHGAS